MTDIAPLATLTTGTPITYDILNQMIAKINALVQASSNEGDTINISGNIASSTNNGYKIVTGETEVPKITSNNTAFTEVTISLGTFSGTPLFIPTLRDITTTTNNEIYSSFLTIKSVNSTQAIVRVTYPTVTTSNTALSKISWLAIGRI